MAIVPAGTLAATHDATANGNAFTGGLSFDPSRMTVAVGDTIRWTNTDPFVPHTVTEAHGLFDRAGDYGETPANPPGFGPGESVEWRFAAGTFDYYCRVHPEMTGRVEVPVELERRGSDRHPKVATRWGREQLPEGQVFDVVTTRRNGRFKTLLDGTRKLRQTFDAKLGKEFNLRALVRLESDPDAASALSPQAKIKLK